MSGAADLSQLRKRSIFTVDNEVFQLGGGARRSPPSVSMVTIPQLFKGKKIMGFRGKNSTKGGLHSKCPSLESK